MSSSEITTGTLDDYKALFVKLKNLCSIIKKTASSSVYNTVGSNPDKVNIKNFFDSGFDKLFPFDSFGESDPTTSYDNNLQYVIDAGGETPSTQNLNFDNVQNSIFKNILKNCINLKIDQTVAGSTGDTNSNTLLTALSNSSRKQHLLFYNKLTNSGGKYYTQNFDEKICKNIYYTIFLLDVYIRIVEAVINSNIYGMGNEEYWNNGMLDITGAGTATGQYDNAKYADYNLILEHRDLVKTSGNEATFRDYANIHVLYNKLYEGDSDSKPVGKWVTNSDATKQPPAGLYLYMGDDFKDRKTYKYFNSVDTLSTNPLTIGIIPAEVTDRNYTFARDSNHLANFSKKNGNKYTYKEYSFATGTGDFTDAKKPYQKYIRMFLIMIRNIKFHNLKQTLHYLLIYLKCVKSLLLSSIRSINIYFNLVWSLTNCLALNYPSYKEDKSYKFIEYISIDTNTLSAQVNYTTQLPADYAKNSYVYRIGNKSITSETDSFKNVLNAIDNNIYSHIYILNESIPLTITNLDKYGYNNDGLLYTKFNYIKAEKKIKPFATDKESLPITDTFIKLNNNKSFPDKYILIIPSLNIRANIAAIETNIDPRFIDIKIVEAHNDNLLPDGSHTHAVYVIPRTTYDIERNIIDLKNNINKIDENINSNKTKILNNASLYESHKSKNTLLYNQLIAYIVIISFVIIVLLTINVANIETGLLKFVSLLCFGVIVVLLSVYYIINTIYIDENYVETFTVVKNQDIFNDICKDCTNPKILQTNTRENSDSYKVNKKTKVESILTTNAKSLSSYIDLALLYTDSQTLYNKETEIEYLEKNRHDSKNYANYVLEHKKDDAFLNMDVVKYENSKYNVYLLSMLLLSLIIIGSYTINIYTNNNFILIISVISIIFLISLFTYYIININRTVRTISSNYYWGREFPKSYENYNNFQKSKRA